MLRLAVRGIVSGRQRLLGPSARQQSNGHGHHGQASGIATTTTSSRGSKGAVSTTVAAGAAAGAGGTYVSLDRDPASHCQLAS